ncbi:Fic family protein [Morganella psychrotolerans]|uniref:Fic family protein n=1 Tax=Morganella psychrotolerans TaxID=368603 RepID=UPI0039B0ECBE
MMDLRFLTVDEVIEIQKSTLPNSGKPDIAKLEGALSRIETLRDYEHCDDIFKFSAMYLISIAKAHAFNDANIPNVIQDAGRRQGKTAGEHTLVCDPAG